MTQRPHSKKIPHHAGWGTPVADGRGPGQSQALHSKVLLNFVELLVNQHCQECEQKDARPDAEDAHGNREPVNLRQQLCLLFLHV